MDAALCYYQHAHSGCLNSYSYSRLQAAARHPAAQQMAQQAALQPPAHPLTPQGGQPGPAAAAFPRTPQTPPTAFAAAWGGVAVDAGPASAAPAGGQG